MCFTKDVIALSHMMAMGPSSQQNMLGMISAMDAGATTLKMGSLRNYASIAEGIVRAFGGTSVVAVACPSNLIEKRSRHIDRKTFFRKVVQTESEDSFGHAVRFHINSRDERLQGFRDPPAKKQRRKVVDSKIHVRDAKDAHLIASLRESESATRRPASLT